MRLSLHDHRGVLWVIGLFTLMRLTVAPSFGLGVDEAHYLLYGRYLDLSYVDHPPLVGWVQAFVLHLFGGGEFSARIPAVILMALTTLGAYRFLLSAGANISQAVWGITALNASFIFGVLGLMLLPENFLLPLLFPLMEIVLRLEREGKTSDFIYLGILLGLFGLSKYTAILIVPAIAGYLLGKRRFDLFINPRIVWSFLFAAFIISPVMIWNAQHDWISFLYQSEHVAGGTAVALKPFIKSLSTQIGAYNPFLYLIALYGWVKALRSQHDTIRLAVWIGTLIALFFTLTSFLKPVLPHWPALFYLLFIPLGVVTMLQNGYHKTARGIVIFSLFLSVVIHAELLFKWGHFPDYKSPFRDIYGYDKIAQKGSSLLSELKSGKKALAITNWTYGSRMIYYAAPYKAKVFTLDEKNRQFALWEGESPQGYDLVVITSHFTSDITPSMKCSRRVPLGTSTLLLNGGIVDTFSYTLCEDYWGKL